MIERALEVIENVVLVFSILPAQPCDHVDAASDILELSFVGGNDARGELCRNIGQLGGSGIEPRGQIRQTGIYIRCSAKGTSGAGNALWGDPGTDRLVRARVQHRRWWLRQRRGQPLEVPEDRRVDDRAGLDRVVVSGLAGEFIQYAEPVTMAARRRRDRSRSPHPDRVNRAGHRSGPGLARSLASVAFH